MKKVILLVFTFAIIHTFVKAQDTVYLKKEAKQESTYTDRPPQVLYAELYGRGLIYSINYDRRFNKHTTGAGFSAGAGVFGGSGFTIVTIPVSFNYLLGKKGKYFETGIGATYINGSIKNIFDEPSHGSTWFGTLTAGYRSQPIKGGFCFRAGLNIIAGSGYFGPFPYVSFGYCF